jgi:hypothetical protein
LWSNVIFGKNSIAICIKVPKSRNPKGEIVDLFSITEGSICPVSVIKSLYAKSKGVNKQNIPIFQFKDKSFLSCSTVNNFLIEFLRPVIGNEAAHVTGHSFRAALPLALVNSPDIANESDVKQWGRWSSSAYKLYTRLAPRQKRVIFQKILASLKLM